MEKKIETKNIKQKMAAYCAYQERTQAQVREKLHSLNCVEEEAEELIVWLIQENFLNEERFAKAYAGGKFRIKKWGRLKIKQGLKQLGLSEYCIRSGMKEIEEDDYAICIKQLVEKKWEQEKSTDLYIKKNKVARYIIAKGYEQDLIWEEINALIANKK